jgi:hypothetical protein
MPTIKIVDRSLNLGIILDKVQVDQFMLELARATQTAVPAAGNDLAGIDADAEITVAEVGQPTQLFELYGRSVLLDLQTKKLMQFYMGLLVLEWLHR